MPNTPLDTLDSRIVEILQREGRIANVDLAARVQLSAPQLHPLCQPDTLRMLLRGYRADVEPQSLGLGVTAFVSLNIEAQAFVRVRDIEALLKAFPEILECHTVSGDCDYLLKVVAGDLKSLSQFLTDKLMQLPGVADVRSMICLEEIKPPSPLPVR